MTVVVYQMIMISVRPTGPYTEVCLCDTEVCFIAHFHVCVCVCVCVCVYERMLVCVCVCVCMFVYVQGDVDGFECVLGGCVFSE